MKDQNDPDDNDIIVIQSPSVTKRITVSEYKKRIRDSLLIELADIFSSSANTIWRNYEISDFLNSYRDNGG